VTTTTPATSKPRRRWLRFSLRTLLVLMLLFGAVFGWFAREVQQARAHREAVKAIEKLGGGVTLVPASGGMMRTAVGGAGKLLGEDLSYDVSAVLFSETQVTDAGLEYLQALTKLEWLDLDSTLVSDAGLVHLTGLTKLQTLYLGNTQVTGAGVNELRKALPNVKIER